MLVFSQRQARSHGRPEIDYVNIADLARRKQERSGLVGITPGYANAVEKEFYQETMRINQKSWWSMEDDTDSVSEELYSKRGTQSGIVSEMSRRMLSLDS